jgi:ABC-type Fe3+-siderophore transport system permease subunit
MDLNTWLKGLGAAMLGSAVVTAGGYLQNRLQNGKDAPPITGAAIGLHAGLGAVVALLSYLTQSPLQQPTAASKPANNEQK